MITRTQAERLAAAVHYLRPDWPIKQIATMIMTDLSDYPLRDLGVALTYIALDQNLDGSWASNSPYRIKEQGPWLTAGPTDHQIRRDQQVQHEEALAEMRVREQAIARCPYCDDRGYLNGSRCPHEDPEQRAARVHTYAEQAREALAAARARAQALSAETTDGAA
jgi:hypothetical protein